MAWIESHTVLIRHRKLVELSRELRLRKSYVMGHLHALWHAALEQSEDGDLSTWSDELIAEYSDFPGDAPQYVRLLQKHGFLDGKLLHDWLDYAGLFLIKKYSSSNVSRLSEIWTKHGREYGVANKKRTDSEPKESLPNLPVPNQQKEEKACTRRFIKPTPEEASSYASSQGFELDGGHFVDYYEARGWKYKGGTAMKDWRAAVRTWKRNTGLAVQSKGALIDDFPTE